MRVKLSHINLFMRYKYILTCALLLHVLCSIAKTPSVYYFENSKPMEVLAGKELQRYLYLRTGHLPSLTPVSTAFKLPANAILVATSTQFRLSEVEKIVGISTELIKDDYQLKSTANGSLLIVGGTDVAVLYGTYKFLESTGIGFAIDGDLIPDEKISHINLSGFNKVYSPSFELRGIQPFHDFAEGPDWWNKDDYEAIIAQLPKMGMNFIGFHTYPETTPFGGWNKAEPMVWIGTKENINADGTVKKAYPVLHANTGDSTWGYYPKKTSQFHFGASQIFETDVYGADYMQNVSKWPHTTQENIDIFNKFGSLLSSAFTLAKDLGVKTCIGTEVPLVVPRQVKDGIANYKILDADSINQALYEGVFTRIKRTHPLDYYWFWTPESWTWEGEAKGAVEQTEKDLTNALAAAKKVDAPFTLATCGWVLGPARDRAEFDRLLPKDMPFGVINRQQGYTPVEQSFAKIQNRPKWEITWLEDDPALTAPQFWAGRALKDAVDAYKYGCTGFMGIHWRTENLSPAFMALAKAGWDAKDYKKIIPTSERDYPVKNLYLEWTEQQFGIAAAIPASELFNKLDGAPLYVPGKNQITAHFPRSAEWGTRGPGQIAINRRPWSVVKKLYGFIDDYKKLKPLIKGTSNNERYVYWLNTFLYAREQAHIGCILGQMELKAKNINNASNKLTVADSILILRNQAASRWGIMVTYLLQTVNKTGEMGTVANLEEHSLGSLKLLNRQDSLILAVTRKVVEPLNFGNGGYKGPSRLIMTTKKTLLNTNEDLNLKIRVLSATTIGQGTIYWRSLAAGKFMAKPLNHINRGVYNVVINSSDNKNKSFEYYVVVKTGSNVLRYPSTKNTFQSVVLW